MLLSLTKKFLLIANLKTASTSMEQALAPHAELRLVRAEFGKHLRFDRAARHFKYLFSRIDMKEVFVFGVIREPVDYVLSMYNSHTKERFRDRPALYTGGMDFARFLSGWAEQHPDHLRPQISRFTREDGSLATNLLISFDNLHEGLAIVAERIKVPALTDLPRINESPRVLARADLTPDQLAWIAERFRPDTEAMALYCNRVLATEPHGVVRAIAGEQTQAS